jgi:hypothetical protein
MELRLPDIDALGHQRLLAGLHRPPVAFTSRNSDIKSPVPMVIHDAITNHACSTIEDHVCPSQNAENRHPMGTEFQNGVFTLTKPLTLLTDRQGRIAYSHAGVVDKDSFELDIEALLTTTR